MRSLRSCRALVLIASVSLMTMTACSDQSSSEPSTSVTTPPVARVDHQTTELHGTTLVDDYGWLRERESQEVLDYLEAENSYTESVMAHTADLNDTLYNEMVGRIQETDLSVPVRMGPYYYYSRTEEGRQYSIYCRKKGDLEAEEEVLLDANELAGDSEYFSLGAYEPSPDHNLLAYSVDLDGSELYTIRVKDLRTGELLSDEIPNTSSGVTWGNDNATLFYVTRDEARRPYKAWRHLLGEAADQDEMIFHEADESFFLGMGKTRSRQYILLALGSSTTNEWHYLDADTPRGDLQVFAPRRHMIEYSIDHHGDYFYVVTNDEAKNFRMMRTPVGDVGPDNWREVIAHREDTQLESVDSFADFLVISERFGGLRRMRVWNPVDESHHFIEMPEEVYAVFGSENEEFDSETFRFRYASLTTPWRVYDYHVDDRELELKKETPVLGGYDREQYVTERIFATAEDGTEIPMSVVYRKDTPIDGTAPALLYGYGSYGASLDPFFSSSRVSLLDRGMVFAMAHIRGGGEMGERWHDEGKLLAKRNTFTDFIAAGEHLIAKNYSAPDRLAIQGGSAGGLLIGAVINMRPDLFAAAHAAVPFVDVMNTMLDPSIPLTVIEYEEWGNPNEKEYFDYMLSYSPYDNVADLEYPDLLITAGLNDPRVQYWEPAKWAAKLRVHNQSDNRLLLKTNMGAGHGGASGRYDALKETAFEYGFILDSLGVTGG